MSKTARRIRCVSDLFMGMSRFEDVLRLYGEHGLCVRVAVLLPGRSLPASATRLSLFSLRRIRAHSRAVATGNGTGNLRRYLMRVARSFLSDLRSNILLTMAAKRSSRRSSSRCCCDPPQQRKRRFNNFVLASSTAAGKNLTLTFGHFIERRASEAPLRTSALPWMKPDRCQACWTPQSP